MANWKGTLVPNSGTVEKVYVNINLTIDEVKNILKDLNYISDGAEDIIYYILCPQDSGNSFNILANQDKTDFIIQNGIGETTGFIFSTTSNAGFVGWNAEFDGIIDVNSNVSNIINSNNDPVGAENDKLTSLFSITPFTSGEETTADKLQKLIDNKQLIVDSVNAKAGTSYDIHSKPSDIAKTIDEIEIGSGDCEPTGLPIEVDTLPSTGVEGAVYKVSNYVDVIMSENGSKTSFSSAGIPIGSIHFVDSLPSNPTGSASAYGIYIINSTGVGYAYDGSSMNNFSSALGNKLYVGNISSMNDTTGNGIYVLENVLYYVYSNGAFTQISSYGDVTITENGTHNVSTYSYANVNVPIPEGYIVPSGTKKITTTGEHDVTSYAKVNVDVPYEVNIAQLYIDASSAKGLFAYWSVVYVDDYLNNLNFTGVGNMSYMFYRCSSMQRVPSFYTSDATNMDYMFYNCNNMRTLGNIDMSNVTTANSMFYACSALTTIPQLNTSKVTNMCQMFYGCWVLTSVPQLNTSNVTEMRQIFYNCRSLTTIPQLDTSNITAMNTMFNNCSALTTIDITYYNLSTTTASYGVVSGCTALKSLIIREFGANYVLSTTAFENSGIANGTGYIYVPSAMVDTLKSATNWSTYASQIRALEDYTVDGTTTGALDETKI